VCVCVCVCVCNVERCDHICDDIQQGIEYLL